MTSSKLLVLSSLKEENLFPSHSEVHMVPEQAKP
jgi:hypothetical protein